MNDYDALRAYLAQQTVAELSLTFQQIEDIIGEALPRAAQRASWWDSLRSPDERRPQREACLAAGFVATRAASGDAVKFKRLPKPRGTR